MCILYDDIYDNTVSYILQHVCTKTKGRYILSESQIACFMVFKNHANYPFSEKSPKKYKKVIFSIAQWAPITNFNSSIIKDNPNYVQNMLEEVRNGCQ